MSNRRLCAQAFPETHTCTGKTLGGLGRGGEIKKKSAVETIRWGSALALLRSGLRRAFPSLPLRIPLLARAPLLFSPLPSFFPSKPSPLRRPGSHSAPRNGPPREPGCVAAAIPSLAKPETFKALQAAPAQPPGWLARLGIFAVAVLASPAC